MEHRPRATVRSTRRWCCRSAASTAALTRSRFLTRSGSDPMPGSATSCGTPSASHRRRHMVWPMAAIFRYPSLVANTPVGTVSGCSLPVCSGTLPSTSHCAARKSSIATCASSSEVCTHCPSPDASRSSNAVKMPMAQKCPAHRSARGCPPASAPRRLPVTLISPHALGNGVEAGPACAGTVLAEAGDAGIDRARIDRAQSVGADAEAVLTSGRKFSMKTSARLTSSCRISRPAAVFMFSVRLSLLRCRFS